MTDGARQQTTTHEIEITERQRKRLDSLKEECSGDHLPDPSDEMMVSSLLDTWDAVGDGLYTDTEAGTR